VPLEPAGALAGEPDRRALGPRPDGEHMSWAWCWSPCCSSNCGCADTGRGLAGGRADRRRSLRECSRCVSRH